MRSDQRDLEKKRDSGQLDHLAFFSLPFLLLFPSRRKKLSLPSEGQHPVSRVHGVAQTQLKAPKTLDIAASLISLLVMAHTFTVQSRASSPDTGSRTSPPYAEL